MPQFALADAWLVGLFVAFAVVPLGAVALIGLRWRFDRKMFGRVYVWDRPWSVISQDRRVHEAFERLKVDASVIVLAMLLVLGALVLFV
ncbi:MAG: hypothetical protein KI785_03910 [Devosiaceae bacterium]|nr:hypothetical protein [Devosiaceae bacterium MH13]